VSASGTPASPQVRSWAWWRSASLADVTQATGSRVRTRFLLAAAAWVFLVGYDGGKPDASVAVMVSLVIAAAAWFDVVRKVGWGALIFPYVRPVPFLGYWLWVWFAPPSRGGALLEWIAWLAVVSPFVYVVLAG
jgi:hypothetical protein